MEKNVVYQYSILNALMAGVADSGIKVSEFIEKGNQGLGTFTKIQGELVLLDSKVYQLQSSGDVRTAGPDEQLPYAVCTHFEPQRTIKAVFKDKSDLDKVLDDFDQHAANLFISYRIDGRFKKLKARTVSGQEYQDQPLAELGAKQAVREYTDIEGSIVGFRVPHLYQGVSVAGFHSHFIDKDRKVGGHVLEMASDGELEVKLATLHRLILDLPTSEKFNAAKMETDDAGVKNIEG